MKIGEMFVRFYMGYLKVFNMCYIVDYDVFVEYIERDVREVLRYVEEFLVFIKFYLEGKNDVD